MTTEEYRRKASDAQMRAAKCKNAVTRELWLEVADFWQRLDAQDKGESTEHKAPKRRAGVASGQRRRGAGHPT